jgi:hypothetical protein
MAVLWANDGKSLIPDSGMCEASHHQSLCKATKLLDMDPSSWADPDPTWDKADHTPAVGRIQSTTQHQSLVLGATEKSTWRGREMTSLRRPLKRSSGRLRKKLLGQPIWP